MALNLKEVIVSGGASAEEVKREEGRAEVVNEV
jgi:hypothetical protein